MILAQPLRCNGESVCVARVKQPLTTFPLLLELGSEGFRFDGIFRVEYKNWAFISKPACLGIWVFFRKNALGPSVFGSK